VQELNHFVAVAERSSSANSFECSFLINISSLFQVIMEFKIDHYYITCFEILRLLSHPLPNLPGRGRCSGFDHGNRFGTVHK